MRDNATKALVFAIGAAVGSVVTWAIVKKKYETIVREEIQSVKETFSKRGHAVLEKMEEDIYGNRYEETFRKAAEREDHALYSDEVDEDFTSEDLEEYENMLDDLGYTTDEENEKGGEVVTPENEKPYVINPRYFGDEGYEEVHLNLFADGVLADDWDKVIKNSAEKLGEGSLDTFGQYEPDAVYVRDDVNGIDYEITLDVRRFQDLTAEDR